MVFKDRTQAGKQLGDALRNRGIKADVVLAIPRGGLPLGRAVADALGAPLDVVIAKKIGAPGNPEYAIGAVAADGTAWRSESALRGMDVSDAYFEQKRETVAEAVREKTRQYRTDRSEPDFTDKSVVIVDDGVATGATARACLLQIDEYDTEELILAVPVGPPDTIDELRQLADTVVCLETPSHFRGVGQFYQRFDQVSDAEAMAYLDRDG